ncbi:MAG: efflux RND transporter periplasmic adaptor subunit [Planctomycetota bacterium]
MNTLAFVVALSCSLLQMPQQPDAARSYAGVSRPADVRELAFGIRGTVAETLVEPGDRVEPGDLLIRLDDRVQAAQVELSRSQAEDDSRLKIATLAVEFQRDELEITLNSRERGGAADQDVREAQFAYDRSLIDVKAAEADMVARNLTLERETARLDEMRILAPIAGDIVDTPKQTGETVDELTTVITLVNTDQLHIDVTVAPNTARAMSIGQPATVVWQDIDAEPVTDARVIFIPATGDPSVRQVAVRVEVPNPDRLPSGLHARVSFPPQSSDADAQGSESG